MRMSRIITILSAGALILLAACTKSLVTSPYLGSTREISVASREFRPTVITVPVGTIVTWVNKDAEEHTVTSSTGLYDGTLLGYGSFSYTFNERGTFEYSCQVHAFEGMTGRVVVE